MLAAAVGARRAADRLQAWSVVGVGAVLAALPVLFVAFGPEVDPTTMGPPVVVAAGIVAVGGRLRAVGYTPGDVSIVAVWVAASAVTFAVVVAITIVTVADGPAAVGAFAATLVAPLGACGGLLAGYIDARRRRQYRRTRRTRLALEAATDGVAIVDDGEFVIVNRAHAEMYGFDAPEEMVGRSWETCHPDHERRRLDAEAMPKLDAGEAWRGEATGRRADGETFPQELTLTPIDDGDYVCIARDIGDRRERERQLRRQTRRLKTVVESAPIILFAVDDTGDIILIEGQGLSRLGVDPDDLRGTSVFELGVESPSVETAAEQALEGESGHATLRVGGRVLKTWFTPVIEGYEVDRVIGAAIDITDRHERERRLTELHEGTRRLTYATTRAEVAEAIVEVAAETLEKPLAALWRHDPGAGRHRPVAMTDAVGDATGADRADELPDISAGDPAMAAFHDGDTRRLEAGGPFDGPKTIVAVPLGEQGVLVVGEHESVPLDEAFRRRVGILGLNAGAALDRADREQLLRERSEELEARASQMEFVNSIIRHDVFNGVTVIRSRAAFLADALSGRNREYAETIVEWCDDIAGLADRAQTVLSTLGDEETVDLEIVDAADVVRTELDRLERTYPAVTFETDLPETVPVRADEALVDVVGNVVTNAVEHNDREGLEVTASASVDDGRARLRVADNGAGIDPDRLEAVFDRGDRGASDDSGFGLFFVDAMIEAYGGDVSVENDDGAVFTLELPAGEPEVVAEGDTQ